MQARELGQRFSSNLSEGASKQLDKREMELLVGLKLLDLGVEVSWTVMEDK